MYYNRLIKYRIFLIKYVEFLLNPTDSINDESYSITYIHT